MQKENKTCNNIGRQKEKPEKNKNTVRQTKVLKEIKVLIDRKKNPLTI